MGRPRHMMTMKTMYVADLGVSSVDETPVRDSPDGSSLGAPDVETQVDGASDDRAEGLGGLPHGEVEAAVLRRRVADDDGGLAGVSIEQARHHMQIAGGGERRNDAALTQPRRNQQRYRRRHCRRA